MYVLYLISVLFFYDYREYRLSIGHKKTRVPSDLMMFTASAALATSRTPVNFKFYAMLGHKLNGIRKKFSCCRPIVTTDGRTPVDIAIFAETDAARRQFVICDWGIKIV